MEYPYGHHTHKPHRRDDDDEREEYPPPPRSGYNQPPYDYPPPPRSGYDQPPPDYPRSGYDQPPPDYPPPPRSGYDQPPPDYPPRRPDYPPPEQSYYAGNEYGGPPPPRPTTQNYGGYSDYPPPPQRYDDPPPPAYSSSTTVQHVSHDPDPDPEQYSETHHSHRPHLPSFLHHHTHESSASDLSQKPTFKVYCKTDQNFHLTIRDDKVVLARSDPNDEYQNWYKDEKFSTRVKDKEGFPCFAIVNKATGQAVKHSIAASHPVQLVPYNADVLDQSILWTESKDLGDGYRAVRMVNNISLNFDAFLGDKKSGGGVHDGTTVGLWNWNKGDNQRWRITPH